jgi:hypothetical protein
LRLKLLIVASLLAAVVGAGSCFAVAFFLLAPTKNVAPPLWAAAASLIVPLAATVYATIFVYRHTSRRRVLQAAATALLALLLTLTALLLCSTLNGRPRPEIIPATTPNAKTS